MKALTQFVFLPALLLVPIFAATGQEHTQHQEAAVGPAAEAYMEAHMKMMKNMDVTLTGDPDRDFVRMMIPHHQGAIDMAEVELKYGEDEELKELAKKIIAEQKKEIERMRLWQEQASQ